MSYAQLNDWSLAVRRLVADIDGLQLLRTPIDDLAAEVTLLGVSSQPSYSRFFSRPWRAPKVTAPAALCRESSRAATSKSPAIGTVAHLSHLGHVQSGRRTG